MNKAKIKEITVFILLYIIVIKYCTSQVLLPQLTPTSPETASILKFQETPVSFYTGLPKLNVPLYKIDIDGISLPIQLNYHAGGIRVSEIASPVGLGWDLVQGGQITRVVKGLADEKSYLVTDDKAEEFIDLHAGLSYSGVANSQEIINLFQKVKVGDLDYEPDEFIYSFMGYSGKFVFNQTRTANNPYGELVMLPETDLLIKPVLDNLCIVGWEILTPDGAKYIFGGDNWDDRLVNGNGEFLESTQNVGYNYDTQRAQGFFSAWGLKKIITPNQRHINFEYTVDDYYSAIFNGQTKV